VSNASVMKEVKQLFPEIQCLQSINIHQTHARTLQTSTSDKRTTNIDRTLDKFIHRSGENNEIRVLKSGRHLVSRPQQENDERLGKITDDVDGKFLCIYFERLDIHLSRYKRNDTVIMRDHYLELFSSLNGVFGGTVVFMMQRLLKLFLNSVKLLFKIFLNAIQLLHK
jgi:hypothetical protein